jgi:hypothetical protein
MNFAIFIVMKIFKIRQLILKFFFVCVALFASSAFSQQLELFDGNGIPTIEASQKETFDPSFLRKLRAEIQAEQMKDHEKSEKSGWYKSVNKRFVPESATFFVAGGGVYFLTMMAQTNSDPALMVKHIESLKDPIAHISFYAFMAANGMYTNFKTKGMDPMTKQLAMKTLQYKGMAIGSLASSFTADVLGTFKECAKGWINNKSDESSYSACDESLKTWTVRNKFTQYIPQILSLIVSQYASDAVMATGQKIKNKVSGTAIYTAEASALKLFKISSASVDLIITSGGVVVRSMAWLGKLQTFGMFLAIDHLLTPSVMRIGNNVLQPFLFQFDVNAIDRLMKNAGDSKWSSETANKPSLECSVKNKACKSFDELPKEIENFTYRMQQWRMHLNSKVENDLNGWQSEVNKLLHQIDFSKNFYRSYLENLYATLQRSEQVQKGEFNDEPNRAWATQTIYPYRTLPLYGVKSGVDFKAEKENDLYLIKPWLLQKYQSQNLQKISNEFLINIKKFKLDSYSEKKFKALLTILLSDSANEQAKALIQIADPIRTFNKQFQDDREFLNQEFLSAIHQLKIKIGNPAPVIDEGAGFSQAYISRSTNLLASTTANFKLDNGIHRFNKATDLMFYNMICGSTDAKVHEGIFTGLDFMPARISNHSPLGLKLCEKNNGTATTDSLYKITLPLNQKNVSTTQFLVAHLNQDLLGNISDADGASGFNKWWIEKTLPAVQIKFKDLDARYQTLVSQAYGNILDQKGFVDFTLDLYTHWSERLGTGILDNLDFELEFYTQSLENILLQKNISTQKYIDSIITLTQNKKNDPIVISKDLEKSNAVLFKILKIKKTYKELLDLLKNNQNVDFKNLESMNTRLKESMDGIFEKFVQFEKNPNLPAEVKSLFSIKNGLEALEMDLKRYLFMKVNLANRLEIETSQMNDFLKGQRMNKVHSGAKPHGGG